jgi:hypothetical protein
MIEEYKERRIVMKGKHIALFLLLTAGLVAMAAIPPKPQLSRIASNGYALIAGRNVNMVSGIHPIFGDPYLQRQNEPSIAVSTRNPLHLLAGANDYRTLNTPFDYELPGFEHDTAAKDAWLGVYKSIDGGQTWRSSLHPGFPQDPNMTPPLFGYGTAADPVVRSGPNGLFFYCGIAFDRIDRGSGVVFVSRFIDNNNKENVDTIALVDTYIADQGNAGQFIDKPWLAVDVPQPGSPDIPIVLPDPNIGTQLVSRTNVYLVYSVFVGKTDKNVRSKILFMRSTDSGMTWEFPTKLTESQHVCQGATIAIDPRGNGHVYVAWRRFATPSQPDAIVVVKSTDGGATFSQPVVVATLGPWLPPSAGGVYDQATTAKSFRTNDYPSMAVDGSGNVYIVWSQRGLGPQGEARIVISTSSDGLTWPTPPIQALHDFKEGDPDGYEFMPSLTFAAGKLTMLWYDQRWDWCTGHFDDPFIEDVYPIRHTIDVRLAQATTPNPVFDQSIQVSRYPFLLIPQGEGWLALQLSFNMPNLPLFMQGTVPFIGDYIDLTPSPLFLPPEDPNNPTNHWIYNTHPNTPTVYHAVWTDNRDVLPPLRPGENLLEIIDPEHDNWDEEFTNYTPLGEGGCNPNFSGTRNQNVYTSRISEGILAGSPGNSKKLNILRSFVVIVKNTTGYLKDLRLKISEHSTGDAYFWENATIIYPELTDIIIPPYSYVSKTVLVEADSNEYASVLIEVFEEMGNGPIGYITLNPDSTNPEIDDPEGWTPDNPHIRNEGETHTPHIRNTQIIEWNYEEYDPNITTKQPPDEDVVNADTVTPYPVEDDPQNPHIRNPHIRNPHIRNNLLNPHIRNSSFPPDIPDNSAITDVIFTIENTGNTTSSYSVDNFPTDVPDGILAQLIVFKTYNTPTSDGCSLVNEEHHEVIINEENPHIRNLGPSSMADSEPHKSVELKAQEKCYVLYRFYNPLIEPEQIEFHNEEKYEDIVVDFEADVPDTDPNDPTQLSPAPPPKPLVLPPQILPQGVAGLSYTAALQADGGSGTYQNWNVIEGDWPSGLSLDPLTGTISGQPAFSGIYDFRVQVNDVDENNIPLQTAQKWLTIRVVNSLTITTTTLFDAFRGGNYSDLVGVIGGIPPYTWNLIGSLPLGLNLDQLTGTIQGIVDDNAVTADFSVQVTDSSPSPLTDTQNLTIDVYDPPQITTLSPLPNGNTGAAYNVTLSGIGGNAPYIWSVNSGALPPGLNLDPNSGEISGTPTSSGTYLFEIWMTDSSNPQQVDSRNFSIAVTLKDLVAYYPFNGNANDESGNGNHGTVSGATLVDDIFGNANSAYYFDGIDDIITTQQEHFAENNHISVSLLVKVPGPSTGYFVMCSDFGVAQAFSNCSFAISLPDTNSARGALTYNEWQHFVGTYDGDTIRAYMNGLLVDEISWPGTLSDPGRVLTYGYFNNDYWEGHLDEVRIYNRDLAHSEIIGLYANYMQTLIDSTFDSDTVDQSPQTGGPPDQPTSLTVPSGATILVKSSSNGITSQPVEINDGGTTQPTVVYYSFSPVAEGKLFIEADVSLNNLVTQLFFRTNGYPAEIVTTDMMANANGEIYAEGQQIGSYQTNIPFRVRMFVDLGTETYSAIIDDEMNGFEDDQLFAGIPCEHQGGFSDIRILRICVNTIGTAGVTINAFDNIVVKRSIH